MVRLVSRKIDGVEGGSATPSSTPTPKASTWEQVEERQQRRRGMPKPPKPPAVPKVAPTPTATTGVTPPPGAPKPTVTGEMPSVGNVFWRTTTRATRLPEGTIKPWKAEINYEGLGLRPAGAGKAGAVLTPAQRAAAKLLPTLEQFGSPVPLRGIRTPGGRAGALFMLGAAAATSFGQGALGREQLVEALIADQYPKDVAEDMATAYMLAYTGSGTALNLSAEGLSDASFMAASATIGALLGTPAGPPGIVAGAAAGWAASRVIAGASALINLAEVVFSAGSVFAGANGIGEGKMVNLPSLDDFWVHGGFDENGNQRNGLFGWNVRAFMGDMAHTTALTAARAGVDLKYPGRFLTDEQAIEEERRIKTGHYASSADVDPKYDDYKDFIQEGYFVYKDNQGRFKVNVVAVQEFLLKSVRYTQQDDLRAFLPPKTAVGDEFYKSQYLTDEMLATMWDIPEVMP